jgi:hypothetical protein
MYALSRSASNFERDTGDCASERAGERRPDATDMAGSQIFGRRSAETHRKGSEACGVPNRTRAGPYTTDARAPTTSARFVLAAMSSISFPHSAPFGSHSASSSVHDDAVFSPSFESASSSFQMNPLSQHPPRTPRTSIISNAASTTSTQVYGQEIYNTKEDTKSEHEGESVDEELATPKPRKRVRHEAIWKEVLSTSNGRDKALVGIHEVLCCQP